MRSGGYTVHHSLTAEAATIVKQALSLARRRGHAQVTPLHVASSMLSSSTCLLRKACLQSHSHPLQCKALELCFNVALNRLPTSASSPLLGPQSHHPSMSNSLVAAFKRAQAHQRRGTVENQNQPILALKVEIEQLIISILDDPSVSRVMREAGFSSTQVKAIVEQAVSSEICSQSQENTKPPLLFGTNNVPQFPPISHFRVSLGKSNEQAKSEDVMSVIDTMMNKKKKNTIVVGECLGSAECVIKGVIDKFERGDNSINGELRFVQFISLPLFSLRNLSRQAVEEKLEELRCLVKSYMSRGVVLYLGDLKWVAEFWSNNYGEAQRSGYYCPVEHMIMEINRLLCGIGENGKLWVMGIANFKTYMRCKSGHPSLESLWELYPLTVPVGSLELSLNLDQSDLHDQFIRSKMSRDGSSWFNKGGGEKRLTCCADCSANMSTEAPSIAVRNNESSSTNFTSSSLPSWLQQYKEETKKEECDKMGSLCKKWNSICSTSVHKNPHFASPLSSSTNSMSSQDHQSSPKLHQSLLNWPVIFEPNKSPKEHQFFISDQNEDEGFQPNLRSTKPDLLSNPNSSPNSASSSEASEDIKCLNLFKQLNSKNFKILCNALEKKVPWQTSIIPEIVSTILRCRSGTVKRKKESSFKGDKEETWLFFLGVDCEGKEKIAKELANAVFGSQNEFIAIGLSSFSSTRADSTDQEFSNKRSRNEHGQSYMERFAEAVQDNPSRVFFMEDIDQVDYQSQMGIKNAIESGRVSIDGGDFVLLKDAIIIFSCESFSSMSRACSPPVNDKEGDSTNVDQEMEERRASGCLDLNITTDDDGGDGDEKSVNENGILDSVDRQVIFKIQIL